jgi:hypothetical protein
MNGYCFGTRQRTGRTLRSSQSTVNDFVNKKTHDFMGVWLGQLRQALTKDFLTAFRIQTEEFTNRKNEPDRDSFPRQISQSEGLQRPGAVRVVEELRDVQTSRGRIQVRSGHQPFVAIGVDDGMHARDLDLMLFVRIRAAKC